MLCHRGEDRCCYIPYPPVVYLYFVPHIGLTGYHIHDPGFPDEYQAVHTSEKA